MSFKEQIDRTRLPRHVAIIMDGNGRWAKERNKERTYGHQYGAEAVRMVTEASVEIGIEYLTLYAFSTENWKRPDEEVDALMALMVMSIENETPTLMEGQIGSVHTSYLLKYMPHSGTCVKLFYQMGNGRGGKKYGTGGYGR